MKARRATVLETVSLTVPEDALEAYESALAVACGTVGFFLDEGTGLWTLEGVKDQGVGEGELAGALALAALVSGVAAVPRRARTEAEGWLARTREAFPEQLVGRRFAVRGTHLTDAATPGRLVVTLDAGIAFGSGEHGSTRGCLRALEGVAHRRPLRVLDLGTGSGILAMAAAKLLHRRVLATDIDPWSVRVTRENARRNGLGRRLRVVRADGWGAPVLARGAPYDLVFANILARPLTLMARDLARHLAPGGTVILAGLLASQARWVLSAHRAQGLVLERVLLERGGLGDVPGRGWATLVLRRRG
ncbi:MAG: 50S ribosomal protein L11 methyltransferase [Acetobacteraceae bacterium]|nr:50S ribosomal protein L11 methyltransferase [Acetobacteraceae bacterium]